ncbi:TonB-dependent receptor [Phenylobacterium deserti]|nr:TonB-dependent receptor [Phenylobacterium deserti]
MQSTRGRLLASSLFATVAAFAVPATVAIVGTMAATTASAQDYTSGTLAGNVADTSGAPVAGATVTVRSVNQGFTRNLTTDNNGRFRAPLLPIGRYGVTVSKAGLQGPGEQIVNVSLGGESSFDFTLGAEGTAVEELVVTGAAASPTLDFAATTRGTTVDIEEIQRNLPIARNIQSVALLAPTVLLGSSSGDATFANQPSVGGASIAENAFYVNGLNITNFNTYVGGGTVPFEFYKTVEVKTGGYPAEFGRATGGVINAVTKSGTNDFYFALHGNYESRDLATTAPDTFQYANRLEENNNKDLTVEIGGPIIRDRLFVYGIAQFRDYERRFARIDQRSYNIDRSDDPFYGAKVDWLITDRQRLEGTYFNTQRKTLRTGNSFDNTTGALGAALAPTEFDRGGESFVFRYTGTFTDWFTLSAAYGKSTDADSVLSATPDVSRVEDTRSGTTVIVSDQKIASNDIVATEREFYRIDGDFYVNLFGQHHIRVGYDNEQTTLFHVTERTGGQRYIIRRGSLNDRRGVPAGQDYIEVETLRLGGLPVEGSNESYYIQDSWDITPNLNLQIGLRNDIFTLNNLAGEEVLNLDNNWGPRIGVTFDPFGEGKDKFYASFGRYFVPPASNLSYRGADLGFSEFFLAPAGGVNASGAVPTLGTQITTATNPTFSAFSCPAGGVGAGAGVQGCTVSFGVGIAEPAYSKTSRGLKATYEDEFQIGYTRQINDLWRAGAAFTYRTLKRVSEDITLDPYVRAYCERNGIEGCDETWNNSWQYIVMNPGEDIEVLSRGPLPGGTQPTLLKFTAEELGFPKPKREYLALEMTFERAFDGKWGLQGSYVLSESKGNYEGTVLSDIGQDDAGSTILNDFAGLTDNQFGLLPNHRAHQFKLFGSYAITDQLLVGANARVMSPKHFGCLGVHPTDSAAADYGHYSRYCGNYLPSGAKAVWRGSAFETDWVSNVDLSVRYTLNQDWMPLGSELVLRADLFNVFNSQGVTEAWEFGETDSGAQDPNYGSPIFYQNPRYLRVGFDLTF